MIADEPLSPEWWEALQKAGAVPKYITRMIIDVQLEQPAKVYFECHGDSALCSVIPTLLEVARIVSVNDMPPEGNDGCAAG